MKITEDYKFTFGKHKGETVKELVQKDPSYLVWCIENFDWFKVSQTFYKMLLEKANKTTMQITCKTVLHFGKYKEHIAEDVAWADPEYMLWAEETLSWFEMTDELKQLVHHNADAQAENNSYDFDIPF
jgi:uncharacterized protein (DUF3820 family)